MALLLDGQTAFITGGGSGIGRAAALGMAREGARILVADLGGADETAELIKTDGGEAFAVKLDVTDEQAVNAAVDSAVARWGRLDIGFNNAGINIENRADFWERLDLYDRTIEVNQRAVLICMMAELRHMAKARKGAIVNTASVAGETGIGGPGYCASKHAVIGLTRAAALRFAEEGIRVNAICPGATETGMMGARHTEESRKKKAAIAPMNRIAAPSEIADAVIYLASERASFITGHAMNVDGGFMAW
jgi:NAD(P)-dependent dehydrogenase (short-subunit alcohol dehydrogenase family)